MLKFRKKRFLPFSKLMSSSNHYKNINEDKKAAVNKKSLLSAGVRKKLILFFCAFLFIVIAKIFIVDAYRIPTSSMANTLLSGDYVIVNKAAYSISTPSYLPFTNTVMESKILFSISTPGRGDVVVFQFPSETKIFQPVSLYFIKRIVGLPGDTLAIKNKILFINGKEIALPVKAKMDTNNIRLNTDPSLYFKNENWSADNMGPIVVPYKGMKIKLDNRNIYKWGMIINREYGKKVISVEGTVITINGKPAREYTFQKNYYFLMGDNRDNSIDSRYHGFVPENLITGKAEFIYWSTGSGIRWKRLFTSIQ